MNENNIDVLLSYYSIDKSNFVEVRQQLIAAAMKQPQILKINLRNVAYIDSKGLGCLVTVLKHVREWGGNVRLRFANERICMLLELTNMDHLLPILDCKI